MRDLESSRGHNHVGSSSAKLRALYTGHADLTVLVLHGGRSRSQAPTRPWQLAYLRMLGMAHEIGSRRPGSDLWVLRNRVRGFNEPDRDPLIDARDAIARIRTVRKRPRIALLGHSMGGRTALLLGAEPNVVAVCALAPWIESGDPNAQLANTRVLILHGDRDRTTSASASEHFARCAERAGFPVRYQPVLGDNHTMLRKRRAWTRPVGEFLDAAAAEPLEDRTNTPDDTAGEGAVR